MNDDATTLVALHFPLDKATSRSGMAKAKQKHIHRRSKVEENVQPTKLIKLVTCNYKIKNLTHL